MVSYEHEGIDRQREDTSSKRGSGARVRKDIGVLWSGLVCGGTRTVCSDTERKRVGVDAVVDHVVKGYETSRGD